MKPLADPLWWERDGLRYDGEGSLHIAGREWTEFASLACGRPVFVYDANRVEANIERVGAALQHAGLKRSRLFYAMKSNRFMPLLSLMKSRSWCGIDACSPAEVERARQCGFCADEISFTATSLSDEDLRVLSRHRGLVINCDSLSAVRRLGALDCCDAIGLRINPAHGIGYSDNERLRYAGTARPTKFGIYRDTFEAALDLAGQVGLRVRGLHFHAGCGFLSPQLEQLDQVFATVREHFLEIVWSRFDLEYLNMGGGLGIPLVQADMSLDLDRWAALVARHFGGIEAAIWMEPGDYFVKDSGVLLVQANTVEQKGGCTFVGINAGFNVHIEPAFYDLPLEIVPTKLRPGDRERLANGTGRPVTIAGNINEALDIFAGDTPLPPIEEGDTLALLNAGGYGSSMSSNHCMRGDMLELLVV